jgi:transglutaminase-like putative cysteine protease
MAAALPIDVPWMLFTVRHLTSYSFSAPVTLGRHRLMLRPRDSFDLRIVETGLAISPQPALTWTHDVYGNSICWADFGKIEATFLIVDSSLAIERFASRAATPARMAWTPGAPVAYAPAEAFVLAPFIAPAADDAEGALAAFALAGATGGGSATVHPLLGLSEAIHRALVYVMRFEEGTQQPGVTLQRGMGTCRDYAWLFIECARRLGYAARFVTGYIHTLPVGRGENNDDSAISAGFSHAWAEAYIPGDGWVEFDPTNLLVADRNLIRVAVTRTPAEASPVSGEYFGLPQAAPPQVEVTVTRQR